MPDQEARAQAFRNAVAHPRLGGPVVDTWVTGVRDFRVGRAPRPSIEDSRVVLEAAGLDLIADWPGSTQTTLGRTIGDGALDRRPSQPRHR